MPLIRRLWAGEVPLAQAFWWYAVGWGLVLNLAFSLAFLGLLTIDASPVLLAAASTITVPYNLLVTVAVWRSAGRYTGPRQHAELARAITVALMAVLSLT